MANLYPNIFSFFGEAMIICSFEHEGGYKLANEHPIQGLMQTAMENLRDMVDVNTIIGSPVETPDGQVIIPVSKVGFGFAAGGSEFSGGIKHTKTTNGNG